MTAQMLSGVRVVDLTTVVFGPYATQTLADLGADVIKVEQPGGDMYRYAGKAAVTPGMGPAQMNLNRGKRSIVLDLKSADDAATMRELISFADIFIHNVRSDAIARLGFAPEAARALNPGLIYIHCVGFGSGGPYEDLQAYDDVIQAATGTTSLAGRVDGDGGARYLPSLLADKVAGLLGAQAALAAYVHKLRTGQGQFVEVPMFEGFAQFMLVEHFGGLVFDPPNAPVCYSRQIDPDRQPFPTKDGFVSIVPYTLPSLPIAFAVLGDRAFIERPEFANPMLIAANMGLLYRRIAELTPARTSAEWVELFAAARIPCMAARDIGDILEDPHLQAAGFFRRRTHPTEGGYFDLRPPVQYSAYQPAEPRPAPLVGEHDADVRAELARLKSARAPQ
jgi:crotonobetainyl-CoA:carnitine CoA-transferase CaiB-like acyl-CoA transferase